MAKNRPYKKEKVQLTPPSIQIGGNVIDSVIIEGNNNRVIVQQIKQLKIASALFTIPAPVTDFTGRDEQLSQLKTELSRGILIIGISGGSGVGKTELARKLIQDVSDNFPDARMNIDLLGMNETPLAPEEAMRRILEPFYAEQELPHELAQLHGLYQQTFSNCKALLLLDNASSASQVRPLIPPAPSAAIITSRQYFSLTEFGLKEPLLLNVFSIEKSRELLQTASAKLNASPANEVDKLSQLCGYLPLALRVAASLLNDRPDWTLDTLLIRLSDERTRLQRLKRSDDIDLDVEATISLSYYSLSDEIKKRFRMLSVFGAKFSELSISAIWDVDDEDLDQSIGILVTRSLLTSYSGQFVAIDTRTGEIHIMNLYALHDLNRLFASNQLHENVDEVRTSIERHAAYFLDLAMHANDEYRLGDGHIQRSLNLFRSIWPDLFLAWQRMQSGTKDQYYAENANKWLNDLAFRCSQMLRLSVSAHLRISILQAAIESPKANKVDRTEETEDHDDLQRDYVPTEVVELNELGDAYFDAGQPQKALPYHEKALAILESTTNATDRGKKYLTEVLLGNIGKAYFGLGESYLAIEYFQKQLAMAHEIGHNEGEAIAIGHIGNAFLQLKDFRTAIEYYEQQLIASRRKGYRSLEATAIGNIGNALSHLGDAEKAIRFHEQALVIAHEIGNRGNEESQVNNIGLCYIDLRDFSKAIEVFEKGLAMVRESDNRTLQAGILVNLGTAYYGKSKEKDKTRELWEAALTIYQALEDPHTELVQTWLANLDVVLQEQILRPINLQVIIYRVKKIRNQILKPFLKWRSVG
jgi:tetratricopeptide (TPR) repeat protein